MDSTVDELDFPLDMIMDISSVLPPQGLAHGSVSLGLSPDSFYLPQPMAEASLTWTSTKVNLAQHLPGPHLCNVHPAHHTAAAQNVSAPYLSAVYMNTMYSLPPSQAPVGLAVVLASPEPSQEDPMVTSHHATHPLGPTQGNV